MWVLAGDIGGTNTRLQLAECQAQEWRVHSAVDYASGEYAHLRDIVRVHLKQQGLSKIAAACFAVAGPVQKQSARITNLPWVLEAASLQQHLQIDTVSMINDFSAIAHGLAQLTETDLVVLQQASVQPDGAMAILGAGTGLGMAIVKPHADDLVIIDGEGGHMDFAPRTEEEIALFDYWRKKLGRVSYETFLSGKGLTRIFEFLSQSEKIDEALAQDMITHDPAASITEFALRYKDPLAMRTLKCFVRLYAAQAGNLALLTKATGGVYLAGGIAPRIISFLQGDEFLHAFNNKPPMQQLLATISVRVIMNTRVGLLGALKLAKQMTD